MAARHMLMNSNIIISIDYEKLLGSLSIAYIMFAPDDPNFTIIAENNTPRAIMTMVQRDDVAGKPLLEAFPHTSSEYKKTGISQPIESFRRAIRAKKPDTIVDDDDYALTQKALGMYWFEIVGASLCK